MSRIWILTIHAIGVTMFKNARFVVEAVVLAVLIALCSCSSGPSYPDDVMSALEQAGDNRSSLEAVLEHFVAEGDSLKTEAAYYLIGNMEGHCYVNYKLVDTSGTKIDFNVLDYPDFDSLLSATASMEDSIGELDFDRDERIDDLESISSDFLINQINGAFTAWREKPWASSLSFDDFLKYVLPYRGSNEPLEPWREKFLQKYEYLPDSMSNSGDPLEAARLINDDIKTWFTFDPRFYYHPTDLGLAEMMEIGLGRCEDMTNVTIYAMRANGLAVTSDYTPHWANAGNNHAWNAILTPDGSVIPFMGAEANPGRYSLANKLAKVYRKTFGKQKENLVFQERKQKSIPGWLAGKSYEDVTADYIDVCDVCVELDKQVPDSIDVAYLCVFNSGHWKAIQWGRIEDGTVTFLDMGLDIAYMPALYINEEIVPYGSPFILQDDCTMRVLRRSEDEIDQVTLTGTTSRRLAVSTDGVSRFAPRLGTEYELNVWSDGWTTIGKKVAQEPVLVFDSVPSGGLYWLTATDTDKEERIFTIEDGKQIWW